MTEIGTANDYVDLLDRLNDFLTLTGSSFGLTYSGTGTGTLTVHSGGATSVAETVTITATSATNFTVVGSVSGSIGPATVGTPFNHTKVAFLLTAGGTAFVSGDVFELSTAPKWVGHRMSMGAVVLASQGNTGQWGSQNLVDGKNAVVSTWWHVDDPIVPLEVEFTFFTAETITTYQMAQFTSYSSGSGPEDWDLQYWNGSAWITLDSQSGVTWTQTTVKTYTISSPVSATRYRLHITATVSIHDLYMGCVRLLRSDGVDAAFGQTIWEAPGNDGASEILVGVHPFERQDADYFDWELAAFDGYDEENMWREQVGHHGMLFLPLWDGSMPYWFVADGRRVIVVAKINLQYEIAYLGFLDNYLTPDQYPYPICIGGSLALGHDLPDWDDTDYRWSNSGAAHNVFTHSDPGIDSPYYSGGAEFGQLRVREINGQWVRYEAQKNGQHFTSLTNIDDVNVIWPYGTGLELLEANLDGTYMLLPVMLNAYTPNTVGQLNGVCCITGQGLTAETTVTRGVVDWIVMPNVAKTERDQFLAIALD